MTDDHSDDSADKGGQTGSEHERTVEHRFRAVASDPLMQALQQLVLDYRTERTKHVDPTGD